MSVEEAKAEIMTAIAESPFGWTGVNACSYHLGEELARAAIAELVAEARVSRRFQRSGSGTYFQVLEALPAK